MELTYTSSSSFSLSKVFGWLLAGLFASLVTAFGFAYLVLPLLGAELYLGFVVGSSLALLIEVIAFHIVFLRGKHSLVVPYFIYAVTMGILLSSYVVFFEVTSILYAFLITAGIFGVMALYGAVTKNNLFSMGVFILTAFIGAVILSFVNLFFFNELMNWIVSFVIFGAMILMVAYDVWRIKHILARAGETTNVSIYCAFQLYVDFIYLFIRVLSFVARLKDR